MPSATDRRPRGFTLIELIVVIAIIATLASVVAPSLFGNVSAARLAAAKSQIDIFGLALDAYRLDVGRYPTQAEGLAALRTAPADERERARWRGPYLRQDVPLDPWGREWAYRIPGSADSEGYDVYTLGRDGREGGEGEDADITSARSAVVR